VYVNKVVIPKQIQSGKELLETGHPEKAKVIFTKLLERNKQDPVLYWYKAKCEIAQGQLIMAIATYNDIIKNDIYTEEITPSGVHQELAHVYERSGRGKEAITEYFLLLEDEPASFEGNLKVGSYHYEHHRLNDAVEYLKKAHSALPKDIRPLSFLGKIAYEEEDLDLSEKYFNDIIVIDTRNEDALYYLGQIAMDKKTYSTAVDFFERCALVGGDYVDASHVKRGLCFAIKENDPDAIKAIDEHVYELEIEDPLYRTGLKVLIELYIRNKMHDKLKQLIDAYLSKFPEDTEISHYKDLYRFVFTNRKLSEYVSLTINEFIIRNKRLFERLGYVIDMVRDEEADNGIIIFKLLKYGKGQQKSIDIIYFSLNPVSISAEIVKEVNSLLKEEDARSGFILTPFDYTDLADQEARPYAITLVSGKRLSDLASGINIF
jgi:tetratricopeptide (TPR) repeat protein